MVVAALGQFPLKNPLGAWNQSQLLGALWRIRGMAEKDTLVEWFYNNLPKARINSKNGDLDHGPLCLLREIAAVGRPDTKDFMVALMSDARFDTTDVPSIREMLEMSHEGFALPMNFQWDEGNPAKDSVLKPLLPLWRNELRRHYGLPIK